MLVEEPLWVPHDVVIATHERQIARFGGLPGVMDPGKLESALNRPKFLWHFSMGDDVDVVILAAAYAYGIARNHPFIDGNKRTSLAVTAAFLRRNRCRLTMDQPTAIDVWFKLGAGQYSQEQIASLLRQHTMVTG